MTTYVNINYPLEQTSREIETGIDAFMNQKGFAGGDAGTYFVTRNLTYWTDRTLSGDDCTFLQTELGSQFPSLTPLKVTTRQGESDRTIH